LQQAHLTPSFAHPTRRKQRESFGPRLPYRDYADRESDSGSGLSQGDMKHTVGKFLDHGKAQQKFQQLQKELELAGD